MKEERGGDGSSTEIDQTLQARDERKGWREDIAPASGETEGCRESAILLQRAHTLQRRKGGITYKCLSPPK